MRCGKVVKTRRMLEVGGWKIKELTLNMETVTSIGKVDIF
jgi:hypothetical protein